jgi:hypothetical protein
MEIFIVVEHTDILKTPNNTKMCQIFMAEGIHTRAFQDWLNALEDYLEWIGISLDRKLCLVKMKLKGQARTYLVVECQRISSLPSSTTHLRLERDEIQIAREVWG